MFLYCITQKILIKLIRLSKKLKKHNNNVNSTFSIIIVKDDILAAYFSKIDTLGKEIDGMESTVDHLDEIVKRIGTIAKIQLINNRIQRQNLKSQKSREYYFILRFIGTLSVVVFLRIIK